MKVKERARIKRRKAKAKYLKKDTEEAASDDTQKEN